MSKKLDPRIVRTRQLLADALLALILRKGYNALTVQDITTEATLNRSTFYVHYKDKDDLFQHVIASVLDEFRTIQIDNRLATDVDFIYGIYVRLFEHVQTHRTFYRVMLGNETVAPFTQQMSDHLRDLINDLLTVTAAETGTIAPELFASFVSSAFMGVTRWWIISAPDHRPQQIAAQFMRLTLAGMAQEFSLDAAALSQLGG